MIIAKQLQWFDAEWFLIAKINEKDLVNMWFLQDGATCHIDRGTIDLLKETFNDKDISINGHVN